MTTLRELLCTPYVITVRAVPHGQDGESTRRAELSEVPACYVEELSPWDALDHLEDRLPQFLIAAAMTGEPIPTPRAPLRHLDAERLLADKGLAPWTRYLDTDVRDLPNAAGDLTTPSPPVR